MNMKIMEMPSASVPSHGSSAPRSGPRTRSSRSTAWQAAVNPSPRLLAMLPFASGVPSRQQRHSLGPPPTERQQ